MMKPLILALALLMTTTIPGRCEPLKVVASLSILADMVGQIGGNRVVVTALVGPGGDAHVYQPSPADARRVAEADLIVVNGLGFEGWFDRMILGAATRPTVIVASQGVVPRHPDHRTHDHDHAAGVDPHAWQDVANGRVYVANIARALAAAAPTDAAIFQANAAAYDRRLEQLDAWVRNELAVLPESRRRIITSHDAFGYFADAYGLHMLAPVGLSTESEPTSRQVAALIRQMKTEGIRVVFIETLSDPRLARQIARDAGGVIGGELYADTLSPPDGPAPTYDAMIRHNVRTILAALTASGGLHTPR